MIKSEHILNLFNTARKALNDKRFTRRLTFILIVTSIIAAITTYSIISNSSAAFGKHRGIISVAIVFDIILVLSLAVVIARRVVGLLVARNNNATGSRTQIRIVMMFSLVAAVPTIIVAIFAALFFHFGIQSWFNERVSIALQESVAVAEAYLAEHKDNIRADALAMANDLNRQAYELSNNQQLLNQTVYNQTILRLLSEAVVFHGNKDIIARSAFSFSLMFELEKLPVRYLDKANKGEVVVLTSDTDDKVRAVVKLSNFVDTYLLVGRLVEGKVINHTHKAKGAVNEYNRLKSQIYNLQLKFLIIFLAVSLLLLLAVILLGLLFASAIAKPIKQLVYATERVQLGDLSIRVNETAYYNDEIGVLQRAFNTMTAQLERQRNELIDAYRQIDNRRHFSETVLANVSAGLLALANDKKVTLINKSAQVLLNTSSAQVVGQPIEHVLPEITELLNQVQSHTSSYGEVSITRNDKKYTLIVRIVAEIVGSEANGYVITFDDITALVSAQRKAAWSDLARRVAHEIKNPLTPVHLAAERIKRKYAKEVSEPELLNKYSDTIMRHVSDIGKMVEEFVNFARMPAPVFSLHDIGEIINNTVFSRKCLINPRLQYELLLPSEKIFIVCDASQVDRVVTNLLKNAEESIESSEHENGVVKIVVSNNEHGVVIVIEDNGKGFPLSIIDSVTDPYISTKGRGSGLGLAIVKKIIDDHGGSISFSNSPLGGAVVRIFLPSAQ
jgi:two-component system nitrogen regulation sensor histidine kinase NtrY